MLMSDNFFKNLPNLTHYNDLMLPGSGTPLPENWALAVSDVRHSTQLLNSGKFKEVNIAGASIIAAISNHLRHLDIPFQFLGDGAVVAFPGRYHKEVEALIHGCIRKVEKAYGFSMTAGSVSVKQLYNLGFNIGVARYRPSPGSVQAAFYGNGLDGAERIISNRTDKLPEVEGSGSDPKPDLSGLECRWKSFKPDHKALCLMFTSPEDLSLYDSVLDNMDEIFDSQARLELLTENDMSLALAPGELAPELKIRHSAPVKSYLKLLVLQLTGKFLMKFGIKTAATDWAQYKSDFIRNSDFRKFSNGMKLIVTGSDQQIIRFKSYLESLSQKHSVIYGTSVSEGMVTTCYVKSFHQNHVHFIDGFNGGYTRASVEYKKRLNMLPAE
jgi:hypothetical protein